MRSQEDIDRIVAGMERQAEAGLPVRRLPFGYRARSRDGARCAEPDPVTAPAARACFRLAAAGYPLRRILGALGEEGILPAGGRSLGLSGLWTVLGNPFYCGDVRRAGRTSPGTHEPLVGRDIFEAAQAQLARRSRPRRSPALGGGEDGRA